MSDGRLPPGPFSVLYADPPWRYASRPQSGSRFGGGAEEQYLDHDGDGSSTMSHQDLIAMGPAVQAICAEDALLWMWCTWPTLVGDGRVDVFDIIRAWGFEYVTLGLLWVKTNRGVPRFGQGWYTKSNSEPCLLAKRGCSFKQTDSISQVLAAPHEIWRPVTRHSEKPDEARATIVRFCGDVPRVELFSRHPQGHRGFVMWGNEAGKLTPQPDLFPEEATA